MSEVIALEKGCALLFICKGGKGEDRVKDGHCPSTSSLPKWPEELRQSRGPDSSMWATSVHCPHLSGAGSVVEQ